MKPSKLGKIEQLLASHSDCSTNCHVIAMQEICFCSVLKNGQESRAGSERRIESAELPKLMIAPHFTLPHNISKKWASEC